MTHDPPTARWQFQPRPSPEGRDDLLAFRGRLASALRAGHGIGAEFGFRVRSGPSGSLTLVLADPRSSRWASRVFVPAYESHQWRWSPERAAAPEPGEIWDGRRSQAWPRPFRAVSESGSSLDAVVLALAALPRGALLEWSFRPIPLSHRSWWESEPVPGDPPPRAVSMGSRGWTPRPPMDPPKSERPSFWEARVQARTDRSNFDPTPGSRVATTIESATRVPEGNGLRFRRRPWWVSDQGVAFPMSESEVVLTLPSPACPVSGDPETGSGDRPPRLPLGRTSTGRVIGPAIEPDQGRHLAILGETGMGKSSLLVALSRRVVPDAGLILFDPLGETANALRAEIPPRARSRVTWIAPDAALGLNALEGIHPASAGSRAHSERQLNDLVHSLRRVRSGRYSESGFWGPRLEEMLTRAVSAAAGFPGGTLVDAHALLSSGGRGFRLVPPEAADLVRELGDRIRSRPEDADGARRLLYEVVRSPILVEMLCADRPSLCAADLVAPGRIVLIAGNAATVGEATARYLLSVYLALLWSQLLARAHGTKTFVVLDEAQWFVHESLAEMLRLGRRRNVHVVLATQAIASLPEAVAEAVWTNVADFVAFRGSPDEAREFSRAARGVPTESILALPRGEAAALLGKGNSVHWLRTARVPRGPTTPAGTPPSGPVPADSARIEPDPPALSPGPGSFPPTPPVGDPSRELIRAIVDRIDQLPGGDPVRVSLTELREALDPTGQAVRTVGSILGRAGAIVRTGRDETGACWWVDRRRAAAADLRSLSEETESGSGPPQPS